MSVRGVPISLEALKRYAFLTSLVFDEHEPYFPADGLYYSSCDYFRPAGLSEIRGHWSATLGRIARNEAPSDLGLYVHWPFCASACAFCFCSMTVPGRGTEMEEYARALISEMDAFKDLFNGARFTSVYFGGGTPTFIKPGLLDELLSRLRASFELAEGAEFYIEASPATLSAEKLDIMARHGVNRVTVGVQSLDDGVLKLNNRKGESRKTLEAALELLASRPEIYSGAELMAGLPGQPLESFLDDFVRLMRIGPDSIFVYYYDPRAHTPFVRDGGKTKTPSRAARLRIQESLDRLARPRGFSTPTRDPDEPDWMDNISRQCRNSRRWGASILGLGSAALSHAFGSAWYRHPPLEETAGPRGRIPPFFHRPSDMSQEMRGYCVRHLYTQGLISRVSFRKLFGRDPLEVPELAGALADIAASGKLKIGPRLIEFSDDDRGRRLIYAKHLYDPSLVADILARHPEEFTRFVAARGEVDGKLRPVDEKRVAIMMTSYRKIPKPSPVTP